MEIDYSLLLSASFFIFLTLLNNCVIYRRLHFFDQRVKLLEDVHEQRQRQQEQQQQQQQQQITSYAPPTTFYYQAPSAPAYYPQQSLGPQL